MNCTSLKLKIDELRRKAERGKVRKCISCEQALIMALRMHTRGDCGLIRALITGFQLRYQVNFLDEMNISRQEFEWLIGREQDILSDWK